MRQKQITCTSRVDLGEVLIEHLSLALTRATQLLLTCFFRFMIIIIIKRILGRPSPHKVGAQALYNNTHTLTHTHTHTSDGVIGTAVKKAV